MTKLIHNQALCRKTNIFFKIMTESKFYAFEQNPTRDVYLETSENAESLPYRYRGGDKVTILLNDEAAAQVPTVEYLKYKNLLWRLLQENTVNAFSTLEIEKFLNSIFIHNPKSPAQILNKFYDGTTDIVIETKDQGRVNRILKFSCHAVSSALLNASSDNTNFIYEVTGPMDDEKMQHFNNIFKETNRKGRKFYDVSTADRIEYLKQIGCDIQFVKPAREMARANLVMCGGKEMPAIVGGMLKKFYFENLTGKTTMDDCIEYLAENDAAEYGFDDLHAIYKVKIANLLLCAYTGMRLDEPWDGGLDANCGCIQVKADGDAVKLQSAVAEDFKDILLSKTVMSLPHPHPIPHPLLIYKSNHKYFLQLPLHLRLSLNSQRARKSQAPKPTGNLGFRQVSAKRNA